MKNKKTLIGILTALMMLFTMTGTGAFAAEDIGSAGSDAGEAAPVIAEEEATSDIDAPVDEEIAKEETNAAPVQQVEQQSVQQPEATEGSFTMKAASGVSRTLPTLNTVKTLRGYNSILIKWIRIPQAHAYKIDMIKDGKWVSVGLTRGSSFEAKGLKPKVNYTFRIVAVKLKNPRGALSVGNISGRQLANGAWVGNVSPPYIVKQACVRKMTISVRVKSGRSFGGVYYRKGERIETDGFGGGKYKFTNKKGRRCTCGRITTGSPRADYIRTKGWNYSIEEANYFMDSYMKSHGYGSRKYAIWVSSYTQHMYVFKKVNGNWVNVKGRDWEVSMGKAGSPSPTGNKKVHKKIKWRHGYRYWSCYSGYNALHSYYRLSGTLGNLASHGCIRLPDSKAKWVFNNVPVGARVIVY